MDKSSMLSLLSRSISAKRRSASEDQCFAKQEGVDTEFNGWLNVQCSPSFGQF